MDSSPVSVTVLVGDSVERLRELPDNSVDSVVCDPPYGLGKPPPIEDVLRTWLAGEEYQAKGAGFMNRKWDAFVPGPAVWREGLRVLKPGGHLLSFFGTRTYDIGTLAIRLAGFEIKEQIAWVFGSGFPKSLNISKAIDKAAGAEREVVGRAVYGEGASALPNTGMGYGSDADPSRDTRNITAPTTPEAKQWDGWGTSLKPGFEPICLARKPFNGTVVSNVLEHGTGGLNIDGCRIPSEPYHINTFDAGARPWGDAAGEAYTSRQQSGRWPANLAHDGSDEVLALFPESQDGVAVRGKGVTSNGVTGWGARPVGTPDLGYGGGGSAARFFYCPKASSRDRDQGLDHFSNLTPGEKTNREDGAAGISPRAGARAPGRNSHPTVKPTELMRWLVRMVTPKGGTVLDPFMGSGSTGKGAVLEGFAFVGCELDPGYAQIAEARIRAVSLDLAVKSEAPTGPPVPAPKPSPQMTLF